MDEYIHLIGIAMVGFGLLTVAARVFGWERVISKRQAMKDRFGDSAGDAIHFISYSIIPIVCGLVFINSHYGFL
jgi:hypothetical protein